MLITSNCLYPPTFSIEPIKIVTTSYPFKKSFTVTGSLLFVIIQSNYSVIDGIMEIRKTASL